MKSAAKDFELVVQQLFKQLGFSIGNTKLRSGDHGIDFFLNHDKSEWAVEVKFYRTHIVQPKLLYAAAAWVAPSLSEMPSLGGILVISTTASTKIRQSFQDEFGISLVDRSDLLRWSSIYPDLFEKLTELFEIAVDDRCIEIGREFTLELFKIETRSDYPPKLALGAELSVKLRAVAPGRNSFSEFEEICAQILDYLFGANLAGWYQQKRSSDGSNRYDLVCRVRQNSEFWKFVVSDLRSRYVVFEFKNYREPIQQGQILTTEKYLMSNGLRRVAIVVTRSGCDSGAISIVQGSMREQGKMILVLSDNEIHTMLNMKDKGEDPSDFLFGISDEFLMTLPR